MSRRSSRLRLVNDGRNVSKDNSAMLLMLDADRNKLPTSSSRSSIRSRLEYESIASTQEAPYGDLRGDSAAGIFSSLKAALDWTW